MVGALEIPVILKEAWYRLTLSPMVGLRDVLHTPIVSVGVVDGNQKVMPFGADRANRNSLGATRWSDRYVGASR